MPGRECALVAFDERNNVIYDPYKRMEINFIIKPSCEDVFTFRTISSKDSSFPMATFLMLKKAAIRTLSASSSAVSASASSDLSTPMLGPDHSPKQVLRYDLTAFRCPIMYGTSFELSVRQLMIIRGSVS